MGREEGGQSPTCLLASLDSSLRFGWLSWPHWVVRDWRCPGNLLQHNSSDLQPALSITTRGDKQYRAGSGSARRLRVDQTNYLTKLCIIVAAKIPVIPFSHHPGDLSPLMLPWINCFTITSFLLAILNWNSRAGNRGKLFIMYNSTQNYLNIIIKLTNMI